MKSAETQVTETDRATGAGGVTARLYPKRRSDVRVGVVEGETVVLDRQAELIHQLNQTASYIWDRCDGEHTLTEIADQLAATFDVDPKTAEKDVAAAVSQLEAMGLLEKRSGLVVPSTEARRS